MTRLYILQLIAGIAGGFIAAIKGRNVLSWFLLCVIFPLLTLVILFLPSLKTKPPGSRCPNCSQLKGEREDACSHCGWQKPIELVQCGSCGSFVSEHERCPTCGQNR